MNETHNNETGLEYRIAKLELAPGDTLVAKVDRDYLDHHVALNIQEYFQHCVPQGAGTGHKPRA